ncbi:MAG: TlpA family protein disulfide reductase [Myxococcales bacterium]|nr:TlpA family protein disulfide reductase [Myxococcales bacterium]
MPRRPLVLAVALATAPLLACADAGGPAAAEPSDLVPAFRGEDLRGETIDLRELRGKVVLLNIWASWCEPCKEELPTLNRLYNQHGREGLMVIGVSIDAKRAHPEVRRLVRDKRVTYPIVLDPESTIVPKLKVVGYPTTFIIGRDGAIRWRRDGLIPDDDPEVASELRAALDAPAPG